MSRVAETIAQLFLVYLVFNHEWFQNCWPGDKGSFVISDKLDFPVVQRVKNLPATQETWVWSLGQEDPLEMDWQSTLVFLPGESIPWTEKRGGGRNESHTEQLSYWATNTSFFHLYESEVHLLYSLK